MEQDTKMGIDEAAYEAFWTDLYEEIKEGAVKEFITERIQSYYLRNADLAVNVLEIARHSRNLYDNGYHRAACVFAAVATEVGIKNLLLKPILYGLVNDEKSASLITELTIDELGISKLQTLLFATLRDRCELDLTEYSRQGVRKSLWEEIKTLQKKRNHILHRAEKADWREARDAADIAWFIITEVFPYTLDYFGLILNKDDKIELVD